MMAASTKEKNALIASQAAEIEQWKVGNARLAELERQASRNADDWQARRDEAHKRYEECFHSRGEYIFLSKLQAAQIAALTAQAQGMREALEKICTALFDARIGEAGMVAHAALAQVSASPKEEQPK